MNKTNQSNVPAFVPIQTCAFSGATLLCLLLGHHSKIATVGETNGIIKDDDPEKYYCSCGKLIKRCPFWIKISAIMKQKGFDFDVASFNTDFGFGGYWLVRRLRMCSFRNNTLDEIRDCIFLGIKKEYDQLKNRIDRNEALVESVLEVTGKNIFVDSSKDRQKFRFFERHSRFDVRHIFLVRDVRGFVLSFMNRFPSWDTEGSAKLWVKENKKYERLFKTIPESKVLRIKYEDLCLDTANTLKKAFLFCGVKPESVKNFRLNEQHILGNEMRLRRNLNIVLDTRWKIKLTRQQLKVIDRIAGKLNRNYGY